MKFNFASVSNVDGKNQYLKVAAATYLKNFTRRSIDKDDAGSSMVVKRFKDALLGALLKADPPVLKLLIETVSNIGLIGRRTLLFCI